MLDTDEIQYRKQYFLRYPGEPPFSVRIEVKNFKGSVFDFCRKVERNDKEWPELNFFQY